MGERRAALFGGRSSGSGAVSDDLLIVELSRDTAVSEEGDTPFNNHLYVQSCMLVERAKSC